MHCTLHLVPVVPDKHGLLSLFSSVWSFLQALYKFIMTTGKILTKTYMGEIP